jgi:hypothetical protein
MTNAEARGKNRSPNDETSIDSTLGLSGFVIFSSFVLRHFTDVC